MKKGFRKLRSKVFFIDTIYCDGDDYMFAIFSKDDLEEIINDLRTLL